MKRHSVQLLALALSAVASKPVSISTPKFTQSVPLAHAVIRQHRHSGVAANRRMAKKRKKAKT